jgi:serine/threonine protein kinase
VTGARTIGGYRLLGYLGSGAMCRVHRALDPVAGREMALKVLDPARCAVSACVERFLAEAHAMRAVAHPRVVALHDAGRDGDLRFIAMELMPGGDALGVVAAAGGRLAAQPALELLRDAALGVDALHRAGLVHRDLKPENLLLDGEGRATVADLGLARPTGAAGIDDRTGRVVGTPAYLSPEQARGDADIDVRSDIHALGATLYTLLTGELPFTGASGRDIAARARTEAFPDPRRRSARVPDAVAGLIRACTERERERRPRSALDVVRRCEELLAEEAERSGSGSWFSRARLALVGS